MSETDISRPGLRLDRVEDAIADIAAGRAVVVVDDEDRENEGDIIFAASKATPELMAFTIRHSSGVICVPMPADMLDRLFALGRRHVFLEGGPTVAAAFLDAGLVDEVVAYVAPMLLGAGRAAVADLGIRTIADALHLTVADVTTLGSGPETNVRITMTTEGAR